MIFVDTEFVRGSGLGNRLFPWARSRVAARALDARCLAPQWAHVRRGPLLAGGINYAHAFRKILLLDNFRTASADTSGFARLARRARLPVAMEEEYRAGRRFDGDTRLVFHGDHTHFRELHRERDFVRASFEEIVKPKWKRFADEVPNDAIGLNIRLGRDFATAKSPEDFKRRGALLTPVDWFVEALSLIRRIAGRSVPAFVVTDGTTAQLRPLLSLPHVLHLETPAAVADLYALSRARFLVGTGGSSFAAWASFLGRTPVVSIPGQSFNWFGLADPATGLEVGELDLAEPADEVCQLVRQLFGS